MKRLSQISWKRVGVQAGVLAGLGLAFIGSEDPVTAADTCLEENDCSFKKPNFMIIMDYSTSMNTAFDMTATRWEAAVAAVQNLMVVDNGYFQENMNVALMRFGHDPSNMPGTTIMGDTSGLVDGQKLDVHWYDPMAVDKSYFPCNGQAIIDALDALPPPMNGNANGIGTWTKGALDYSQALILQSRADHMEAASDRFYANLLLTDGLWTAQAGSMQPANENPAITAGTLFNTHDVKTYVVALGDAAGLAFTDEIAMAGGTMAAIDAATPQQLVDALKKVVDDIKNTVIIPECTSGLPRVMIILDASSSMLNVGNNAGTMGNTGWDQARDALAGANSLFDVEVALGNKMLPVEDLVHLGLLVFGHNSPSPGEQKLLVDYGPCMKDNFAWALNPQTSCTAPGCTNPWGGATISWTFRISPPALSPDGTPFDATTRSHMPRCNSSGGFNNSCSGSGTYTHLGLQLARTNQATYHAAHLNAMQYPTAANTEYINILITDGNYTNPGGMFYSTHQEVRNESVQMYQAGITTYVIGFGDAPSTALLNFMACVGSGGDCPGGVCDGPTDLTPACSGGSQMAYDASTQAQLEAALKNIIEGLAFDPCCAFNDCSETPEPTTMEPDTESGGPVTATDPTTGTATDPTTGTATDPTTGTATDPTTGTPTTGTATDPTTGTATATDSGETDTSPTTSNSGTGTGGPGTNTATDTDTSPTSVTGADTGDTDSVTGTGTGGASDDGGCGCSTDNTPRGLLGSLFGLGLAGFVRRRRKTA